MWACLLISFLVIVGCSGKPDVRFVDVQRMMIHASGRSWEASSGEIAALVAAYGRADVRDDDTGTTPPVLVDVYLRSGKVMKIWGGSEGIQGVVYQGRDVGLRGVELGELLGKMVTDAE